MPYVIYNSEQRARWKINQIEMDAREANLLPADAKYPAYIKHPTEDKAAVQIFKTEGVYVNALPIMPLDFSVFFSAAELARSVSELPW